MQKSEHINELAEALAKAQGQFICPERNRTVKVRTKAGGEYTFTYATLDAIMGMVRAPLTENGLAITHELECAEGGWLCVTRLIHASGQFISCPVPILVDNDANAQGWGSAITYAKRYGLCALLAITADEDDDGNGACGNTAQVANKPPAKQQSAGKPKPPAPKAGTSGAGVPNEEKAKADITAAASGKALEDLWKRISEAFSGEAFERLTPVYRQRQSDLFIASIRGATAEKLVDLSAYLNGPKHHFSQTQMGVIGAALLAREAELKSEGNQSS